MSARLQTYWELYDPSRHASKGGNYIFLNKRFQNAPHYTGTATVFNNRFYGSEQHSKLYAQGRRTFMRPAFAETGAVPSHGYFVERWQYYHGITTKELEDELVHVAAKEGEIVKAEVLEESSQYWEQDMNIIVYEHKAADHSLECVELAVRRDLKAYYNSLASQRVCWKIKNTGSQLFGKDGSCTDIPELSYILDGSRTPQQPMEFFKSLQSLPGLPHKAS